MKKIKNFSLEPAISHELRRASYLTRLSMSEIISRLVSEQIDTFIDKNKIVDEYWANKHGDNHEQI